MQPTKIIAKRNEPLPKQPEETEETIASYKETIQTLRHQLQSLELTNKQLLKNFHQAKQKASQYDKILQYQTKLAKAMQCTISLLRLLQTFSPTVCIVGSFLRKCFESMFHISSCRENDWIANIESTPIQILFSTLPFNSEESEKNAVSYAFLECINTLYSLKGTDTMSSCSIIDLFCDKLEATDFHHKKVKTCTLHLGTTGYKFVFHIYAWTPIHCIDFSVNSTKLSFDGFQSYVSGHDMFQTLENILHRQGTFLRRPDQLQFAAYPCNTTLPYDAKSTYLTQIADLLSNPCIQLLESGYTLVGKTPIVTIEEKEDCLITGCKAPYPTVKLQCEHTLSLMAYKGLVKVRSHESTEAIKCPICRKQCLLQIEYLPPTQCIFLKTNTDHQWEKYQRDGSPYRHKTISKDAYQTLVEQP